MFYIIKMMKNLTRFEPAPVHYLYPRRCVMVLMSAD